MLTWIIFLTQILQIFLAIYVFILSYEPEITAKIVMVLIIDNNIVTMTLIIITYWCGLKL